MDNRDPVREYLNSVLESRMEIKRIRRKLDLLEVRALNVTSQLTGMPRGGSSDRDAVLASLADVTADYYARLAWAERHELEVLQFIDSLPDQMHRVILKLRYVDCRRWAKVLAYLNSEGVSISQAQMFYLHGKALNAAREKYKEIHHDEKRDP